MLYDSVYLESCSLCEGTRHNPKGSDAVRVMSPRRAEIGSLRTPLTEDERRVLDFFDTLLPEEWEIYIQPHLNGLRPDFVLLNPHVGIGVFEVKDWNLDAMDYTPERIAGRGSRLLATDRDGRLFTVENPAEKVSRYRHDIINLYCPRLAMQALGDPKYASLVTAGVIMMGTTSDRARTLLAPERGYPGRIEQRGDKYHPIAGSDALARGALAEVFPTAHEYQGKHSWLMSENLAEDLRSWLVEPDFAAAQRQPLELDARQRALITAAPPATGYRRIKGPAGSGKSLVLAARAAHLSAQGKDVLVVTYNMTLWHYLRDLAVRYPAPNRRISSRITWCHFHEWCERVCIEAGMEGDYHLLWKQAYGSEAQEEYGLDGTDAALETGLPALVARAFDTNNGKIAHYDAVLVDEGQDFNLNWWNALRKAVRPGGEAMLVADATQDLYEKARQWTDISMTKSGFVGPWARLDTSYRTPSRLVPYLRKYIEEYLPGAESNLPQDVQRRLVHDPVQMRWLQVSPQRAVQACVDAVLHMPAEEQTATIAFTDVTLLVETHAFGTRCVELLGQKGVKCIHVFDNNNRAQKIRKHTFYMGNARVKACTIHSFKGWETRTLVVHIANASSAPALAKAYVGLSRLKRHVDGSYLTVVCSAPNLETYGRTWPHFEKFE